MTSTHLYFPRKMSIFRIPHIVTELLETPRPLPLLLIGLIFLVILCCLQPSCSNIMSLVKLKSFKAPMPIASSQHLRSETVPVLAL